MPTKKKKAQPLGYSGQGHDYMVDAIYHAMETMGSYAGELTDAQFTAFTAGLAFMLEPLDPNDLDVLELKQKHTSMIAYRLKLLVEAKRREEGL